MKIKNTLLSLVALLTVIGCDDLTDVVTRNEVRNVIMRVDDFEWDSTTRTSASLTSDGVRFIWGATDTVGIYPNKGDQVAFPVGEGGGTGTAMFDGGGWGLKAGYSYTAYYPFGRYNFDRTAIPMDYTGQKQVGNNNLDNVTYRDYIYSNATQQESGSAKFQFHHLGAIVRFEITVPSAENYTCLKLISEKEIFPSKLNLDLSTETPTITTSSLSRVFSLALENVTTTAKGDVIKLYALFPPADLSNETVTVELSNKAYMSSATLKLKDYVSGKAYSHSIDLSDSEFSHQYVDLGLPSGTLWATCNIGASSPEEYGDYFAWGETSPQSNKRYYWDSYKWCKGSNKTFTKYCNNANYGSPVDNRLMLTQEDDAATVNWGQDWRMPTKAEQDELLNNCIWTWTERNGINGYEVKSKVSDNSIFLPATGTIGEGILLYEGEAGFFWSSSLVESSMGNSYNLGVAQDNLYFDHLSARYWGSAVRAVRKQRNPSSSIMLSSIKITGANSTLSLGETLQLSAVVGPENASNKAVKWNTSDPGILTVSESGLVSSLRQGTATITATAQDGSGVCGTYLIDVKCFQNGHEYVDLDLPSGLLWATCNIGATQKYGSGTYFAWGEVTGCEKKSDGTFNPATMDGYPTNWKNANTKYTKGGKKYNFENFTYYKWCQGTVTTRTKYCIEAAFGTVDGKTILEPQDDAATANWGGKWRMPTNTEFEELINNCSWIWTTRSDGVSGCEIKSRKHMNTIFIPAVGYCTNSAFVNEKLGGYYRTSVLASEGKTYVFRIDSSSMTIIDSQPYRGASVRPVFSPE